MEKPIQNHVLNKKYALNCELCPQYSISTQDCHACKLRQRLKKGMLRNQYQITSLPAWKPRWVGVFTLENTSVDQLAQVRWMTCMLVKHVQIEREVVKHARRATSIKSLSWGEKKKSSLCGILDLSWCWQIEKKKYIKEGKRASKIKSLSWSQERKIDTLAFLRKFQNKKPKQLTRLVVGNPWINYGRAGQTCDLSGLHKSSIEF